MQLKIKEIINLLFILLISNTHFLQAHNFLNGGCKNHCKESVKPINFEKEFNYLYEKNRNKDNYSCLNKALCRG